MQRALLISASLMVLTALPTLAQRGGGGGGRGGPGPGNFGGGASTGGMRGDGFRGNGAYSAPPVNPYNQGPVPFSAAGQRAASLPGAGFGSAVFPGGTGSFGSISGWGGSLGSINPVYSGLQPFDQTFAGRLGAVVGGVGVGLNYNSGVINRRAVGAYPVFIGSGFIGGNYVNPEPPTQVTIINQQPPAVIVNPNYVPDAPARPRMQMYDADGNPIQTISVPVATVPEGGPIRTNANGVVENVPAGDGDPTIYLIALKDGTIYASYAYWVEGQTIHYITPGHVHNQVSMDRIDSALTKRLNKDKRMDLGLR